MERQCEPLLGFRIHMLSLLKQAECFFVISTRLDAEPNYLLTNRA